MASVAYVLCAFTSLACAFLLLRGHRRARSGLLFWSGLCFALLAFENLFLVLDFVIFPGTDLAVLRNAIGLLGPAILLFALISEAE